MAKAAVPDLVYYAYLGGGFGEYAPNDIGKAIQIVRIGYQNISYAPGFMIGQYTHPESGTFRFAYPKTQDFLFPGFTTPGRPESRCWL